MILLYFGNKPLKSDILVTKNYSLIRETIPVIIKRATPVKKATRANKKVIPVNKKLLL